jgi:PEP-CTERM motif
MMRYLASTALAMAVLAATPFAASAVTITGNYSLGISDVHGGWSPASGNLGDDFADPFSVGLGTNPGDQSTGYFFTATPPNYGYGGDDTATLTATFTNLSDGTASTVASYVGTATWEADYDNQTDSISWNAPNPLVVDFTDGAVVDITLINASDWAIKPSLSFTLVDGPAAHVPEPSTLSLLGVGLGLLATVFARRYRRDFSCRLMPD